MNRTSPTIFGFQSGKMRRSFVPPAAKNITACLAHVLAAHTRR